MCVPVDVSNLPCPINSSSLLCFFLLLEKDLWRGNNFSPLVWKCRVWELIFPTFHISAVAVKTTFGKRVWSDGYSWTWVKSGIFGKSMRKNWSCELTFPYLTQSPTLRKWHWDMWQLQPLPCILQAFLADVANIIGNIVPNRPSSFFICNYSTAQIPLLFDKVF